MNNFQAMGLSPVLTKALDKLGFTQATSIQAQTIPVALQHKDILGSAQTGTGKTMAFTLPLINQLLNNPTSMGLILTPTRELAQQILISVKQLIAESPSIKTALLIGGEPYAKQLSQLKSTVRIVIGTPGRIIDHLERGSFRTGGINYLVLDETDRMLDMGFSVQLEQIIKQLPTERQTLMFSATFPPKIESLAGKYMQKPERIFINESSTFTRVAQNLTQEIVEINEEDKYVELLTQLSSRKGSILVFVKTKANAERMAVRLRKEGHNACAIHGNLRQKQRDRVMDDFRQERYLIMVATDIAARGLDVRHVLHVVNYDIPHTPEDYIHRIGRTARGGDQGFSLTFVSYEDRKRWKAIQDLLNPSQARSEFASSRKHNARKPYARSSHAPAAMASNRSPQKNRFSPNSQNPKKRTVVTDRPIRGFAKTKFNDRQRHR